MDKRALIDRIIAALAEEFAGYETSARSAHAEATHEQNKAEGKYDTRGLEASYLARGQSRQAAEVAEAAREYGALTVRGFGPDDAADLGAIIELQEGKERATYFLGPRAGGLEVEIEGRAILVITPQSPLGRQLTGAKRGDAIQLPAASKPARILAIS